MTWNDLFRFIAGLCVVVIYILYALCTHMGTTVQNKPTDKPLRIKMDDRV